MSTETKYLKGYFKIPCTWNINNIENEGQKVVVVSIFGQSSVDSNGFKTSPLEMMIGQNILSRNLLQHVNFNDDIFTGIEGFYDPENKIIYLHLAGALDTTLLLNSLNKMSTKLQEKGFLMVWSELRLQYSRSLLLLFCMSHILLLCHPSHVFDITYIHLFRTLHSIRTEYRSACSDLLREVEGVSPDWELSGRICSPRVLFLFSSRLIPRHVIEAASSSASTTASEPLRKLELDLEYQIYRLLRKSHVITNISANSLFSLPNNQPFVYVTEPHQEAVDASLLVRETLSRLCANAKGSKVGSWAWGNEPWGAVPKEPSLITPLSEPDDAECLSQVLLSSVSSERKRNASHSFVLFLRQHTDEALTKGFDDSVGRHEASPFEVPPARVWFTAFAKMYDFLVGDATVSPRRALPAAEKTKTSDGEDVPEVEDDEDEDDEEEHSVVSSLRSRLQTEVRFSDLRCAKVLPLAIAAYKEGLPAHYPRAHHDSKVEVALGVLSAQGRGPMYSKYVAPLEAACLRIWKDGRIGCEALSLTGNVCRHQRHRVDDEGETEGTESKDTDLPALSHSSGGVCLLYCDCGYDQGQLDDPFEVSAANRDFFSNLRESRCFVVTEHVFPSFKSSIEHAKPAELPLKEKEVNSKDFLTAPRSQTPISVGSGDAIEASATFADLSQGDAPTEDLIVKEDDDDDDEEEVDLEASDSPVVEESVEPVELQKTSKRPLGEGVERQASTMEYLPWMLNVGSPASLLPKYPSWSLVSVGSSCLYSHTSGIVEQPGFLTGCNYLLPWNVKVQVRDRSKWQSKWQSTPSRYKLKIFLGVEYSCSRGHRFMMASPDRQLKVPIGAPKGTANAIANSDMPLYCPCPCSRRNSYVLGQLSRIHIVTPKAPVNVTLNPRVQAAPESAVFVPQHPSCGPIKLTPSSYWILRLPFIYVGEKGPLPPPNPYQVNATAYGHFLKGCYGISEITLDK